MKRIFHQLVLIVLMTVFTGSIAFGDTIKRKITFPKPATVNGTVLKEGTYVAIFDDQTNELSITKGGKVIVKAPARLEERSGKGDPFLVFREEGEKRVLLTVVFKKNQVTLLDNVTNATIPQ